MLKACVICGKEFDTDWSNKVCCSAACMLLYQREKYRRDARKYREEHLERARASGRRSYRAHADERRARQSEWQDSSRGKACATAVRHSRRVGLKGVPMTAGMVLELKSEYSGLCPYCCGKITRGCVDHIVPVSRGGTNGRTNLVWVCKSCNSQKGSKSLLEFMLSQEAR